MLRLSSPRRMIHHPFGSKTFVLQMDQHPPEKGVRCPSPFARARSIALISGAFFASPALRPAPKSNQRRSRRHNSVRKRLSSRLFSQKQNRSRLEPRPPACGSVEFRWLFNQGNRGEVLAASVRRPKVIFQRINVFCIDATRHATQNTRRLSKHSLCPPRIDSCAHGGNRKGESSEIKREGFRGGSDLGLRRHCARWNADRLAARASTRSGRKLRLQDPGGI